MEAAQLYWSKNEAEEWELVQLDQKKGESYSISNNEVTLHPANELLSTVDDMTALRHLNEPSILYNIEQRAIARQPKPYTFMSNVLIAVNPLKRLTEPQKSVYMKQKSLQMCPPHPYSIAEATYRQLSTSAHSAIERQSIVISGVSGSGKTETSKLILDYLTFCDGDSSRLGQLLMNTIPITEAFGNAKTCRNDNSSRFGKYMRLQFDLERHTLLGASMDTYLLEKSRLVHQNQGERNFHIFYQLLAAASTEQCKRWWLDSTDAVDYGYLNQSGCHSVDSINDIGDFKRLTEAFDAIGIDFSVQEQCLGLIAGLLHLGNATMNEVDTDEGNVAAFEDEQANESLRRAATLLGLDFVALRRVVLERKISTSSRGRNSIYYIKRSVKNAVYVRDTVAKLIYEQLFAWLMLQISQSLDSVPEDVPYIGVLDIFGFENFAQNRFEQLLINYANEALQSTFNTAILLAEEQIFREEGLNLESTANLSDQIGFVNDCIDLIASKRDSILTTLDNASKLPQPTDLKFNKMLHSSFKGHSCFPTPHLKDIRDIFIVKHYAAAVTYQIESFLDKNSTIVSEQIQQVLENTTSPILSNWRIDAASGSVSFRFREQIDGLTAELTTTRCNFIRCIKPNTLMKPGLWDRPYVLGQLKHSGTIQACRVLQLGLPTRIRYANLVSLFAHRLPSSVFVEYQQHGDRFFIQALLWAYQFPRDAYKLGLTRLFFRHGQIDLLDQLLQEPQDTQLVISRLQKYRIYIAWRKAYTGVSVQLRFLKLYRKVQETRNATTIQHFIRQVWTRRQHIRKLQRRRLKRCWRVMVHRKSMTSRLDLSDKKIVLSRRSNPAWIKAWLKTFERSLMARKSMRRAMMIVWCQQVWISMFKRVHYRKLWKVVIRATLCQVRWIRQFQRIHVATLEQSSQHLVVLSLKIEQLEQENRKLKRELETQHPRSKLAQIFKLFCCQ